VSWGRIILVLLAVGVGGAVGVEAGVAMQSPPGLRRYLARLSCSCSASHCSTALSR
jgi:hypothetical protein